MEEETHQKTFLCVTDGSSKSTEAFYVQIPSSSYLFQTAFKQFYQKGDMIIIVHIADYRKDYLIPDFKPKAIENFFKIELLTKVLCFKFSE